MIYILWCDDCRKSYIGKTSRSLKERFGEHKSSVFSEPQEIQSVHYHFKTTCRKESIRFLPIRSVRPERLDVTETYLINKFEPEFNIRDNKFRKINDNYILDQGEQGNQSQSNPIPNVTASGNP